MDKQIMSLSSDWFETYTGKRFCPLHPNPDEICIEDIAHALSMLCRFGGHCRKFYSIAQHSYYVSTLCTQEDALHGLLHDASEAYIADIVRPLKKTQEFDFYREAEERIMKVIASKFDFTLNAETEARVKDADNIMLVTEANALSNSEGLNWHETKKYKPANVDIVSWSPVYAEHIFLARYRELTNVQV